MVDFPISNYESHSLVLMISLYPMSGNILDGNAKANGI
jgi:hypothetical protein